MYRLLSIVFVLVLSQSIAQTEHISQLAVKTIEGKFQFNYDSQIRQVEISTAESRFTEFDEVGVELGNGVVLAQRDGFVLRPIDVSTYSVLNGNLIFEIVSFEVDKIIVRVFLDDENQELIELIKI